MSDDKKQLTPQESFEEKMKDRLREDVGKLIPDEVLAQLIEKAMQDMFFTKREKREHGYNSRIEVYPSWFEETVEKLLKEKILSEVQAAVGNQAQRIHAAAIELIIKQLPRLVADTIVNAVLGISVKSSQDLQSQLYQSLREKGFQV